MARGGDRRYGYFRSVAQDFIALSDLTLSDSSSTLSLQRWQQIVLLVGKLVLTCVLAFQLARLVWLVVAPPAVMLKDPVRGQTNNISSGIHGTGVYHLFGVATNESVDVVQDDVDAQETRLRLKLLGINKASVPEESSAIIAPDGGSGDFYRIGDTVQGRTRLSGVYADRVILDTNGQLEKLLFDEEQSRGISARVVQRPVRTQGSGSSIRERFSQVRSPTDFMNMANEEIARDPQAALRELGLESSGAGQGYRVTQGSILTSLNLQPGDIVLSVNGQRLGDIEADQMVLQQVSSEGSARIEVQRGNNRFVVNHRLN